METVVKTEITYESLLHGNESDLFKWNLEVNPGLGVGLRNTALVALVILE